MFKVDKNFIFLSFLESGSIAIFGLIVFGFMVDGVNTKVFTFYLTTIYDFVILLESFFGFWVIHINYGIYGREFNNKNEHTEWIRTFNVYRLKINLGHLYFVSTVVGAFAYLLQGSFLNIQPRSLAIAFNLIIFTSLLKFVLLIITGIFIIVHNFIDNLNYRRRNITQVPSPVNIVITTTNNNDLSLFIPKLKDCTDNNILSEECSICLNNDIQRKWGETECGHLFHKECILQWFNIKESCPVCRVVIQKETNTDISLLNFL